MFVPLAKVRITHLSDYLYIFIYFFYKIHVNVQLIREQVSSLSPCSPSGGRGSFGGSPLRPPPSSMSSSMSSSGTSSGYGGLTSSGQSPLSKQRSYSKELRIEDYLEVKSKVCSTYFMKFVMFWWLVNCHGRLINNNNNCLLVGAQAKESKKGSLQKFNEHASPKTMQRSLVLRNQFRDEPCPSEEEEDEEEEVIY